MTILELPYPPSVNSIWRFAGRSAYISKEYAAWKKQADVSFLEQKRGLKPILGPYRVTMTFSRRKRTKTSDLDNRIKCIADALQRFELIKNDNLCEELRAKWGNVDGCLIELEHYYELTQ